MGVAAADVKKLKGKVDHFFHLAAIYDLKATAEAQQLANVDGTKNAVKFANADRRRMLPARELDRRGGPLRRHVPRGHVRGGGGPRSSVLQDQARLGRDRARANASGRSASIAPGSSSATRRPARSTRSTARTTSSRRCRSCATSLPQWMPMIGIEGGRINIVPVDFVADALDYLAHKKGLDGKCFHLTDPRAAPDRRGAQHLRPRRARAADDDARQREDVRLHPGAGALRHRLARPDQARDPRRADRPRHPARRVPVRQLADALRQPRRGEGAQGLRHRGAAARDVRGEALGLLGAEPRSGSLHRPLARGPRQGQGDRRHRLVVGHRQGDGAQARRGRRQGDSRRARRREAPRDEDRDHPAGRQGVDLHRRHRRSRLLRRARRARAEGARRLRLPRQQRGALDPPRRRSIRSTASTISSGRCS